MSASPTPRTPASATRATRATSEATRPARFTQCIQMLAEGHAGEAVDYARQGELAALRWRRSGSRPMARRSESSAMPGS